MVKMVWKKTLFLPPKENVREFSSRSSFVQLLAFQPYVSDIKPSTRAAINGLHYLFHKPPFKFNMQSEPKLNKHEKPF
jgi:hypothetical protein